MDREISLADEGKEAAAGSSAAGSAWGSLSSAEAAAYAEGEDGRVPGQSGGRRHESARGRSPAADHACGRPLSSRSSSRSLLASDLTPRAYAAAQAAAAAAGGGDGSDEASEG